MISFSSLLINSRELHRRLSALSVSDSFFSMPGSEYILCTFGFILYSKIKKEGDLNNLHEGCFLKYKNIV